MNKLCSTLVQLVSLLTALKIIILYVQGCEKRKPKHIITDWMKIKSEILSFINFDRYPIYRATVESRAETTFHVSIDASCRALVNSTFQLESWTDLHGFDT